MSFRYRLAHSQHPAARILKRLYRNVQNFSVPAPRYVFMPILWTYLALRAIYYVAKRVLVCEPLFKTYCTRYGQGVRTGTYIHWIQGKGRILLGDRVLVDGKCSLTFAARYAPDPTLEAGDDTVISHGCSFTIGRRITIGRHCLIAVGVKMLDASGHPTDPAGRLAGLPAPADKVRPITIADNVWIGMDSLILPGTTIGEGSVVSAGSVVRGEIPPYTLVAGNPARKLASLRDPREQEPEATMSPVQTTEPCHSDSDQLVSRFA
ncbi:acyltransferase [Singulisphaera sp. Ch08]|uniref:Acyltransferase n=1 Tax=Singulisphaera sp. Ch08 TaxID=3120278 RepID=A0AAU7CDB9_9BACT